MRTPLVRFWCVIGMLAGLSAPVSASVSIRFFTPSPAAPQVIGTTITWAVHATDTNPGPLTFQFNVAPPGGSFALNKDFNVGAQRSGIWSAQPFLWTPTGIEGAYMIQVVVKDFTSGESASQTASFQVNPLVTGSQPVAAATGNPLVALFSAPSCPSGSAMRINFQQQSKATPATNTNYAPCHPPSTMTFEIGGMHPGATYEMFSETSNGGTTVHGPTITFTTGALPKSINFPPVTVTMPRGPSADAADKILLIDLSQFGDLTNYADVATDLSGKVLWYYYANPTLILVRPLKDGTMLTLQSGEAWNPASNTLQFLRQIDLSGNIIRETNTGAIQQQLLAMGVTDGGPCNIFPTPAPVGSACLGSFHHEAIQTLPNGYTAALVDVEKIFPPGTQGDASGLPVDVMGDIILVLDTNFQVVWYFDAFEHDSGAPQLDITRRAVLGPTCVVNQDGCPPIYLLGTGIAPAALDWLHGNTLYYWPQDQDIVWSSKNQDWVMKIDYQDGTGTGNILWRMGPCGDYTFNNIYSDPWPWFSAQHDVGIENLGTGPMSLFDNGDTRVSPPTGAGSSSGCMPGLGKGYSRGMVLTVDESALQVTPVLSDYLGVYSSAGGSAQLLSNGNYFFMVAVVVVSISNEASYELEILPVSGSPQGTLVLNIEAPVGYRAWQMPSLYKPPIT